MRKKFFFSTVQGQSDPFISLDGRAAVFVFGDSRAAGFGGSSPPEPDPDTVFEYDKDNDIIVEVGSTDLIDVTGGSPWPQFGIDFFDQQGIKPVFLHVAESSATITAHGGDAGNNFAVGGNHWTTILDKAPLALAAIGVEIPILIILYLGINEISLGAETEGDTLTSYQELIDRINTEFPGSRIFIIKDNYGYDPQNGAKELCRIERRLQEDNENVYLTGDNSVVFNTAGTTADYLHPNQVGNDMIGSMVARNYEFLKTKSKEVALVLSSKSSPVNSTREGKLTTFIEFLKAEGLYYDKTEVCCMFKGDNLPDAYQSLVGLYGGQCDIGTPSNDPDLSANNHIYTDTSNLVVTGFNYGADKLFSGQNDRLILIKVKTVTNSGGEQYLFGNYDGVDAVTAVGLQSGGFQYFLNDIGFVPIGGKTTIPSNMIIGVRRDSGTKYYMEDNVDIASSATASSGENNGFPVLGGLGLSGFRTAAEFEWMWIGQSAGVDRAALIDALNDLATW